LNVELFYTLKEVQILIGGWRCLYNGLGPHSSFGQRQPALDTNFPGLRTDRLAPPTSTPEVTLART
jgi:hypothetical protein